MFLKNTNRDKSFFKTNLKMIIALVIPYISKLHKNLNKKCSHKIQILKVTY